MRSTRDAKHARVTGSNLQTAVVHTFCDHGKTPTNRNWTPPTGDESETRPQIQHGVNPNSGERGVGALVRLVPHPLAVAAEHPTAVYEEVVGVPVGADAAAAADPPAGGSQLLRLDVVVEDLQLLRRRTEGSFGDGGGPEPDPCPPPRPFRLPEPVARRPPIPPGAGVWSRWAPGSGSGSESGPWVSII